MPSPTATRASTSTPGDALVEAIKPFAKRTMRPEVLAGIGGFGALCAIPQKYKEPILVSGTDGVGTKLKLAFALGRHDTVGIDLVAMSVNDVLVQGAEPLFFLDYFACGKLDKAVAEQRHPRHRRGLRAGRLRADRRRDRRDARHVPGGRVRPRRLLRRRGGEGQIIDGSTIQPGDALHRPRLERRALERLLADPQDPRRATSRTPGSRIR